MRFTPLLGSKVWFGPRRFGGWGWSAVSWEGWVAMVAAFLGVFVCALLPSGWPQGAGVVLVAAVLLAIAVLKGTSPGGPDAAERFRTHRRGQWRTAEQVEHDRRLRQDVPDEPSVTEALTRLRRVPARRRRR